MDGSGSSDLLPPNSCTPPVDCQRNVAGQPVGMVISHVAMRQMITPEVAGSLNSRLAIAVKTATSESSAMPTLPGVIGIVVRLPQRRRADNIGHHEHRRLHTTAPTPINRS